MLMVGDKVRLIKPIQYGMTDIGEIFNVKQIENQNTIIICNEKKRCFITYKEYEEYFENILKATNSWTDWILDEIKFFNYDDGREQKTDCYYRTNGKRVQVKSGGLRAEACCCKKDQFNLNKGLRLAKMRLMVKWFNNRVEAFAKKM